MFKYWEGFIYIIRNFSIILFFIFYFYANEISRRWLCNHQKTVEKPKHDFMTNMSRLYLPTLRKFGITVNFCDAFRKIGEKHFLGI